MIKYKRESHRKLPHVLNVSGGRSSGLILMTLLEKELLSADRGDVVLFNNTSAEHPATYAFLQRLTDFSESKGIPFFWTEFCTYEHLSTNGIPSFRQTYRLVKPIPFDASNCLDGYRYKGEVFEHFISSRGFLPSRVRRGCTAYMKVKVKIDFLADWFSNALSTERQGHAGNRPVTDEKLIWETHKKHNGKLEKKFLLQVKRKILDADHIRHAQSFSGYSKVGKVHNLENMDHPFLGFIGIRWDEPKRIQRLSDMTESEIIYTPLYDNEIDKKQVVDFWKQRPEMDIDLPYDTEKSNCVYCFMKGPNKLKSIAADDDGKDDSPSSLQWWVNIEKKYGRPSPTSIFGNIAIDSPTRSGFFGVYSDDDPKAANYANVQNAPDPGLPCECFD